MKVSVIIPVYQVEAYVEDCIKSVTSQTLSDIEILCIEDCGTDGSKEIIRRLMQEDERIRLFVNEKNQGLASVRNQGILRASGEYIYFLDSDDMIRQDALLSLYSKAEEEELDVCIFAADFIYESEELRQKFHTNPAVYKGDYPDVMNGKALYKEWMKHWDWMPSQPRYFYRRDFLTRYGIRFIDGLLHEDESFAFDVLMHAERVRILQEAFFIRRFRSDSIMSSHPTMKNVESCIEILDHVEAGKTGDPDLDAAIDYYEQKLFKDVMRKYRTVRALGADLTVSEGVKSSPSKNALMQKISESRLSLYACSSYYQVLIALIKAMREDTVIDLVLEKHGVGTAEVLAEQIRAKAGKYVARIFVIPDHPEADPYEQKETAGDERLSALLTAYVEELMGGSFFYELYDRIHVFWDLGYLGTCLNIRGKAYTLHEDSLDSYKKIRENRSNYAYIFDEKARAEHVGVVPFGFSPYCEAVEVNDLDGIQIPPEKAHACPRASLMEGLSGEQKKMLLDVFLPSDYVWDQEAVLLLTEPFAVTGRLPERESQERLYQEIVRTYAAGKKLVIKAHPRDDMDYKKKFPEAEVLDKSMPMEVLNFVESASFDTAVTVTSSVIQGLSCVKKKIYLGADFLADFRGRDKNTV